jgi:hypothetical protein
VPEIHEHSRDRETVGSVDQLDVQVERDTNLVLSNVAANLFAVDEVGALVTSGWSRQVELSEKRSRSSSPSETSRVDLWSVKRYLLKPRLFSGRSVNPLLTRAS